jgi:hypothetical protein
VRIGDLSSPAGGGMEPSGVTVLGADSASNPLASDIEQAGDDKNQATAEESELEPSETGLEGLYGQDTETDTAPLPVAGTAGLAIMCAALTLAFLRRASRKR